MHFELFFLYKYIKKPEKKVTFNGLELMQVLQKECGYYMSNLNILLMTLL